MYEVFAFRPAAVDLLIRVRHDRRLAGGGRLFACTEGLAELGREVVDLPAAPGRRARRATLALRACRVEIPRPHRHLTEETAKLPARVSLWLVEPMRSIRRRMASHSIGGC